MQVTKGTWRMREQCVLGSLPSSPAQEPGNEAMTTLSRFHIIFYSTVELQISQLMHKYSFTITELPY